MAGPSDGFCKLVDYCSHETVASLDVNQRGTDDTSHPGVDDFVAGGNTNNWASYSEPVTTIVGNCRSLPF